MWSRRALAGAALATLLVCPAHAQIEDSWLEQVDPWGISYLGEDEPALGTDMWRGARGEDLLALMQNARTKGLSKRIGALIDQAGDGMRLKIHGGPLAQLSGKRTDATGESVAEHLALPNFLG